MWIELGRNKMKPAKDSIPVISLVLVFMYQKGRPNMMSKAYGGEKIVIGK